jgi:hypothetical protein
MRKIITGILLVMLSLGFAQEKAKINVVTDLPQAKIYINGIFAGYDAVQNFEVDPGEHYVMVNYRNKKIFAKTYALEAGQVKTIPTAHFVDFKTNVASRGAVDVEAARIRETRGNFGIGIQASSSLETGSLGGLSMKKWFGERFGLQAFGLINNEQGGIKYQSGGRLLVWLADKVVFDAPFSGYLFFGGGSDSLMFADDSNKNVKRGITNGGFGIEFSPFGVNGLFMTMELGSEKQDIKYSDPSKDSKVEAGMLVSGGLHFYF